MRILKFRAWLKKDKKMVGVKMIGGGYLWTDENWIDSINVNLAEIAHEIGVTCEVMQFTGLKDKKGKEIYESDILRVKLSHEEMDWPVSFHDDGFFWHKYRLLNIVHKAVIVGNNYEQGG